LCSLPSFSKDRIGLKLIVTWNNLKIVTECTYVPVCSLTSFRILKFASKIERLCQLVEKSTLVLLAWSATFYYWPVFVQKFSKLRKYRKNDQIASRVGMFKYFFRPFKFYLDIGRLWQLVEKNTLNFLA
jgi:hypothetical protein